MSGIGGATARDSEVRLPKTMKVKSKAAAPRQITAEQILREAKEIQLEDDFKAPKTIITDPEELAEYRCVCAAQCPKQPLQAAWQPQGGGHSSSRSLQSVVQEDSMAMGSQDSSCGHAATQRIAAAPPEQDSKPPVCQHALSRRPQQHA